MISFTWTSPNSEQMQFDMKSIHLNLCGEKMVKMHFAIGMGKMFYIYINATLTLNIHVLILSFLFEDRT